MNMQGSIPNHKLSKMLCAACDLTLKSQFEYLHNICLISKSMLYEHNSF